MESVAQLALDVYLVRTEISSWQTTQPQTE